MDDCFNDKEKLDKAYSDFINGINPDARYLFIPKLIYTCTNPKKISDGAIFPKMEHIFNNKEGSINWMKRIIDWYLGLGEFAYDGSDDEVKYPNQGFMNTRMREQACWHWATEVLVRKVNHGRKFVKFINENYNSKKVKAISVCGNDFTGDTSDLNEKIKYWIELGYHVIVISCGMYCEGSTLPEVMFALDLTDGEGYDRQFQFATRVQSTFYKEKYIHFDEENPMNYSTKLFFKRCGYYITLDPSKHMSMVVNSLNIQPDVLGGHIDVILNKIKNNSMLMGFDVDIMNIDNIQSWIRETMYGSKLEGNIRSIISNYNFDIDLSDLSKQIKDAKESNDKFKKTESKNETENLNESILIPGEKSKEDRKNLDREKEKLVALIFYFTRIIINFVKDGSAKSNDIKSFEEIFNVDITDDQFESYFQIPKKLLIEIINSKETGSNKKTLNEFFNNIFDSYKVFKK